MPYKIKKLAGKPYSPSNGMEGIMFQEIWCDRCAAYNICKILTSSYFCQVKQWTHDDKGEPMCTSFRDENTVKRSNKTRDNKTIDMFTEK